MECSLRISNCLCVFWARRPRALKLLRWIWQVACHATSATRKDIHGVIAGTRPLCIRSRSWKVAAPRYDEIRALDWTPGLASMENSHDRVYWSRQCVSALQLRLVVKHLLRPCRGHGPFRGLRLMLMFGSGASTCGTLCGGSRQQPKQRGHHNHRPGGDIAGQRHRPTRVST